MTTKLTNILIVDDIEGNRDTLSDFITIIGHTAILAEDGIVALKKLRNQPIDLVLLDIMMPEMDGFEVLSHIKDDSSLQHLPVIMITALDDTDSAINCIKMGAEDYLTKPFNRVLLTARISACLERKHLRDKEEDYLRQIEEYNLRLEELVHEQTQELAIINKRLQMLDKAKGDALKFIYYDFQNSLRSFFKKTVTNRLDDGNTLLETVKQSFQLTKIDSHTVMFVFGLNAVHAILQAAIDLASEFASSRQVLIGSILDCAGQTLEQKVFNAVTSEFEFEDELDKTLTWKIIADNEQCAPQKELCANALAELIKTAIKFSRHGSTVNLSCEASKNEIFISIHATGGTIPKAELPQFFETPSNFEKVTPGRHPDLGPSMAQQIITLLGGSVTVENRDSTGISLVVTLKRESLVST